jgi:hypothetical protein
MNEQEFWFSERKKIILKKALSLFLIPYSVLYSKYTEQELDKIFLDTPVNKILFLYANPNTGSVRDSPVVGIQGTLIYMFLAGIFLGGMFGSIALGSLFNSSAEATMIGIGLTCYLMLVLAVYFSNVYTRYYKGSDKGEFWYYRG